MEQIKYQDINFKIKYQVLLKVAHYRFKTIFLMLMLFKDNK